MPELSVWFIRTAFVYLLSGFTAGGLLLIQKGTNVYPRLWMLLPVHIEWLFIGWTLQLAMGVAFWILPRLRASERYGAQARSAQPPLRGNETIVAISYLLLNLGILFVIFDSLFQIMKWISITGRALELTAVLLFAIHALPRIRAFGG